MKQILEQARAALDGVMTEYQRHVITTLGDTMFYECDPAVIRAGTALEAIEAALAETGEEKVLSGKYVIWSNEHRAWWRANSCGYSVNIMGAGLYEKDEAEKICRCAAERHEEMHPAAEALTRATKDWATNATIWGAIAAMGE